VTYRGTTRVVDRNGEQLRGESSLPKIAYNELPKKNVLFSILREGDYCVERLCDPDGILTEVTISKAQ
jgi:hypothetical protein